MKIFFRCCNSYWLTKLHYYYYCYYCCY